MDFVRISQTDVSLAISVIAKPNRACTVCGCDLVGASEGALEVSQPFLLLVHTPPLRSSPTLGGQPLPDGYPIRSVTSFGCLLSGGLFPAFGLVV